MLYGKPSEYIINNKAYGLNPYFFGKCSTAISYSSEMVSMMSSLNPYFFGKCSTAAHEHAYLWWWAYVLILIFLENALRLNTLARTRESYARSLNPYFFGKCSTAVVKSTSTKSDKLCLNPYFFGKCSTAQIVQYLMRSWCQVLILIFLENALRLLRLLNGKSTVVKRLNPYFFGKCSTA